MATVFDLDYTSILALLSAMITPVVLLSACGSLTISTANRLGRTVDRARKLADLFETFMQQEKPVPLAEERRTMMFKQLKDIAERAKLLHRALTCLYLSLGIFAATSLAIGVVQIFRERFVWVPLLLELSGIALLLYTAALLLAETRIARRDIMLEMDFVWHLGQHYVPLSTTEIEQPPAPLLQGLLRRWRLQKPQRPNA